MIRRMMGLYSNGNTSKSNSEVIFTEMVGLPNSGFSLKNVMSFLESEKRASGELSAYLSENVSTSMDSKLREEDGIVQFWESKWNDYPKLSKIAFRIFSTPASSSESERDFSGVKRLVGTYRSLLAQETISDIACVESALRQ